MLKDLNFCGQFSKFREDGCPVSDTVSEKTHSPLPLHQVQGKDSPCRIHIRIPIGISVWKRSKTGSLSSYQFVLKLTRDMNFTDSIHTNWREHQLINTFWVFVKKGCITTTGLTDITTVA